LTEHIETPPPIVETVSLGKQFGSKWAVQDLHLSISRGEVYGLLGPNGAGKTTTLRMIAGLIQPTQGEVQVLGKKPHQAPLEVKRSLGFLTGSTGLYPRLTPVEMLKFFGKIHGIPQAKLKQRIEQLVEDLDLHSFAKQQCGGLSTGQKQRVNICRALLHEPTLLVLDEPTSGLDIISANFILEAIRRCKAEQRAVLFSTHILAETELLCDRIGILHQGSLTREGTLAELLEETESPNLASAFIRIIEQTDNPSQESEQEVAA